MTGYNHNMVLKSQSSNGNVINSNLNYTDKNGKSTIAGNIQNNYIRAAQADQDLWGSLGSDIFYTNFATTVKDLSTTDKISAIIGLNPNIYSDSTGVYFNQGGTTKLMKLEGEVGESDLRADLEKLKDPRTRLEAKIFTAK